MKKKPLGKVSPESQNPLSEVSQALSKEDNVSLPLTHVKSAPKSVESKTDPNKYKTVILVQHYLNACNKVNAAFEGINFYQGSVAMSHSLKHSKARNKEQPSFLMRLKEFITALNELNNLFDYSHRIYPDTFKPERALAIIAFLKLLSSNLDKIKGQEAVECKKIFVNYINYIERLFENITKLEQFYDESLTISSTTIRNFTTYLKITKTEKLPVAPDPYLLFMTNLDGLIRIKHEAAKAIPTLLHNVEKTILEFRSAVALRSDADFIKEYFEYNKALICIKIKLFEFYKLYYAKPIDLWPVLNRDLIRIQHKQTQLDPSKLIDICKRELEFWNDELAKELMPLISTINALDEIETGQRNNKAEYNVDSVQRDLTLMLNLHINEICRQNPLLKALVLANIINCYTVKNDVFIRGKNEITLQFVMKNIKYLSEFVDNLAPLQEVWSGQLFRFINNFIFVRNYIQLVISASEHALLLCEIIFEKTGSDLEIKKKIIDFQIGLIEMQNTLLNFLHDTRDNKHEKEYVKRFYFLKKDKKGLESYNVYKVNMQVDVSGDSQIVVHGIPVEEIIDRNNMRKLKLEAIMLEFFSGQREPVDSDYTNALIEAELHKYQEEIDNKQKQKALDEKEQKERQARKVKEQKKVADKRSLKAKELKQKLEDRSKSKDESKRENPDVQPVVKFEQNKEDRELAGMLNKLLLKLNPEVFDADKVREAIVGLHEMLPQSSNHHLKFKVLSGMGDSYSKIVAHNLNHGAKKHPKQLIVDIKIALNYYNQAELILRRTPNLTFEEHERYYTWLVQSMNIQKQLLEQYTIKFKTKLEKLNASGQKAKTRLGPKWKLPKEQVSHYTIEREALKEALVEVDDLGRCCQQMRTRIIQRANPTLGEKSYYAFQHILDNTGVSQLPDEPPICRLEVYEEQVEQEEAEELGAPSAELVVPAPNLQYRDYRFGYHQGEMFILYNNPSPMMPYNFGLGANCLVYPLYPTPLMYFPPFVTTLHTEYYNYVTAACRVVPDQSQITQLPQVTFLSPDRTQTQTPAPAGRTM